MADNWSSFHNLPVGHAESWYTQNDASHYLAPDGSWYTQNDASHMAPDESWYTQMKVGILRCKLVYSWHPASDSV